MSTNYYIAFPYKKEIITLHIGKSSDGWTFTFRGYSKEQGDILNLMSFKDIKKLINKKQDKLIIFDEYHRIIDKKELFILIEEKQNLIKNKSIYNEINKNHSIDKSIYFLDSEDYNFCFNEFC